MNVDHVIARDDAQALVRLRVFLEHAAALVADRSQPGRHTALIALDGVCEYAVSLSAHRRGITFARKATFPTQLNELASDGFAWKQEGRRGVTQMHQARNQAQHAGALPDPDHMPAWADDAQAFVRGLVQASFGVGLEDVLLADAAEDSELRGLLAAAERALRTPDAEKAFEYAVSALAEARRRWRDQQGDAYGYMATEMTLSVDPRWLNESGRGDDYADVGVFATDLGEYHQLLATRRQAASGQPIKGIDARRALLFAFNWILRWQRFDAAYPRDRWLAHWQTLRPPTTDDSPGPVIIKTDVVGRRQMGAAEYNEISIRVANVPEDGRGTWASDLAGALATTLGRLKLPLYTAKAGTVNPHIGELSFFFVAGFEPEAIMRALTETIAEVTRLHTSRMTESDRRARDDTAVAADFEAIFAEAAPHLFGAARTERQIRSEGEVQLIHLEFNGASEELVEIAGILANRGGHLAATTYHWVTKDDSEFRLPGGESPSLILVAFEIDDEGRTVLSDAIAAAADHVAHTRRFAAQAERERADLQSSLRQLLELVQGTQT